MSGACLRAASGTKGTENLSRKWKSADEQQQQQQRGRSRKSQLSSSHSGSSSSSNTTTNALCNSSSLERQLDNQVAPVNVAMWQPPSHCSSATAGTAAARNLKIKRRQQSRVKQGTGNSGAGADGNVGERERETVICLPSLPLLPSLSLPLSLSGLFRLSLLHFVRHFRHLRLVAALDVFETIFGGSEFWKTLKMFHVVSDISDISDI